MTIKVKRKPEICKTQLADLSSNINVATSPPITPSKIEEIPFNFLQFSRLLYRNKSIATRGMPIQRKSQ